MKSREELEALIEDAIGRVSVTLFLERDTLREATVKRMRREIFTALEAAGCEVVPREPTREMWAASGTEVIKTRTSTGSHDAMSEAVYTAMLSANPFRAKE